jgi:hypothetical protein
MLKSIWIVDCPRVRGDGKRNLNDIEQRTLGKALQKAFGEIRRSKDRLRLVIRRSANRLFAIVYAVGALVTVFLSNDATAVVLTPAVYAATRAAKVEPLPYRFVCSFIANAASKRWRL